MPSMASVNLNTLPPAVAGTIPSLEHLQSDDYFQRMLSIDSALETLSISKSNLELKLQARAVSEVRTLSAEAKAEHDAIPQTITDIKQLVETFEELQVEVRHLFELRARSLRRSKTGIMDLPGEVLMGIFQYFRPPLDFSTMSPDKGNDGGDLETIKNLRLTCAWFRQHSSHLLIRRLRVAPDVKSLELLERVSSHPEIARGERILSIDLRSYMAPIVEDPNLFSAVSFETVKNNIEWLESSIELLEGYNPPLYISVESLTRGREQDGDEQGQEERSTLLPKGMSLESAQDAVLRLERVLEIWDPFKKELFTDTDSGPIEDPPQVDTAVLALRKGYERYRDLYHQQHRLIKDGSFARAVAATAAASKSKVWLSMSDIHISADYRIADLEELAKSDFALFVDPHRLDDAVSHLARPHPWWLLGDKRSWELSQSLLCEIPLAIHAAGAKLAGLDVRVHHPPQNLDLSMMDEQLSCFKKVTEDLEVFKFAPKPITADRVTSLEVSQDFYDYLGAAMGRQVVPNLYLDLLAATQKPYGARFPIEPFLRCSDWSRLKSGVLGNFDVRLEDLRRLIDMLEPGTRLRLGSINLTSRTWAEALDCLRTKVSHDSWLSSPAGAECDDMAEEEYAEIFSGRDSTGDGVKGSKATQYIRSVEGVENPLLVRNTG